MNDDLYFRRASPKARFDDMNKPSTHEAHDHYPSPLLSVRNLSVNFGERDAAFTAVDDVSFDVPFGSIVGVVGESGSGKSVTSLALTRLFPRSTKATIDGVVEFQGRNLLKITDPQLRSIRGAGISYVFQDPLSSLNPVKKCGEQVAEAIHIHEPHVHRELVNERVSNLFDRLGLPRDKEVGDKFPHELSGGMRQRVMMAIALACKPTLLIADEPTTALDVVVQKQIVDLLSEVVEEFGTSILFISHDLALVSSIADTVIVMRNGKVVESGDTKQVSSKPQEAYTQQLWRATPTLFGPTRPALETRGQVSASLSGPLLEVDGISHTFAKKTGGGEGLRVLDDVGLTAYRGETVCIVGESGSGKSTLARCVVGLLDPDKGSMLFNGRQLVGAKRREWNAVRRDIQMVFQDPYSSLNPRMKIIDLVTEGLVISGETKSVDQMRQKSNELLEMVGLPARFGERYPHQFSGGQRQRIAIARALALKPKLLVCDEPVTSLDVSVRGQIVELLTNIQDQEGITYLFITHDIALARQIGDRALVMNQGQIVESGTAIDVIDQPKHSYTQALRDAVPTPPSIHSETASYIEN
ncbi:dipeptide ABC transporter ATP-binding protein [Glutamicibacter creatinolyticus]